MKTRLLFAIVLSAPLALAMGCGDTADDDEAARFFACRQAGGSDCDGDGVPDNPDNPGGVGTIRSGLVVAQAPNDLEGQPFVGDFYVGSGKILNLTCESASSCEVEAEGSVTIDFRCPKHLFLPRTVSGDPDAPTDVRWDKPGDWGLAPNGEYYHEETQEETEVKTWVQDGKILLEDVGDIVGAVQGSTFAWTTEGGTIYSNGTISDDLRTISYHMVTGSGKEYDRTLTLVE